MAPIFLSLLVLCMATIMEISHPFYFLKADNLDQNLSYYVHNARSLMSGEFPLFNFHQFLGTPVFSCIQSAALYIPNYLALYCSWLLLGHYYGTMEFIAIPHLLFAALGIYHLLQFLGLNKLSCCFGAISWAFCGSVINVGDGWIQVVGYAAYFPWTLLYSLRQIGKFEPISFLILVILRVGALFLGNPPYFIYTITFEAVTSALIYFTVAQKGELIRQDVTCLPVVRCGYMSFIFRQIASYLCTLLVAAPLLLPALHQIQQSAGRNMPLSWEEYSQASIKMIDWLNGLIMPFSSASYRSAGEFLLTSHIGWLTIVFCGVALMLVRSERRRLAVFLVLALFSFLWAHDTFVTKIFYHFPIYNRQRFPFKLLFFTSFFLIVTASYGFNFWISKLKVSQYMKYSVGALILIFHVSNLLAVHIATPYETRKIKNVPYAEPLHEMLLRGRIVTVVDKRTPDEDKQIQLLGFDYATLLGLYHFAGYEILISAKNLHTSMNLNSSADMFIDTDTAFSPSAEDLAYFRKWGVQWYILEKKISLGAPGELLLVSSDAERSVLRDTAAKPFVFWLNDPGAGEVIHTFSTNSVNIVAESATGGQLLVNVLHNPFFRATIDGEKIYIAETVDNQMTVNVPAGRHLLKITYSDPYFIAGLYIACGFMLSVLMGLVSFRCKMGKISK